MPLSRRSFVRALGVGSAGTLAIPSWIQARGLEGALGDATAANAMRDGVVRLHSNENPNGPVPAAIRAIHAAMHESAFYPASLERRVIAALAKANGLPEDRIMLGSGSGEILRVAVQAFCSPSKHLVTAIPTFESPAQFARQLGVPVREVPLDAELRIDTQRMLREVRGAGLVFLCNPNNPTGHVLDKATVETFLRAALAADPEVVILVDEAYHEFVHDPAYASALPITATEPRVFVSRTFSKIYGLAGLRVGYAFGAPATLSRMKDWRLPNGIGTLGQVAAIAALEDGAQMRREQELNRTARAFTTRFFTDAGYRVVPSQTNFVLVDVRREAQAFAQACARQQIQVGRTFPPLTNHSRISIGTLAEMERAVDVFRRVLA
jgi:histidinol-phosphate aminotransferase